jgi:hypothetical protein
VTKEEVRLPNLGSQRSAIKEGRDEIELGADKAWPVACWAGRCRKLVLMLRMTATARVVTRLSRSLR